jgi:tetratricopeptide (TPR) repeat protein
VPRALAQVPLAAVLAKLGSASLDQRREAAHSLESIDASGPAAMAGLAEQLAALRRKDDGLAVTGVLRGLRPSAGKDANLEELLLLEAPDPPVERALTTVCLMRALARAGTTPALRQLVLEASDADGAFRPELFRELKQLDERATAALIEARADPSPEMRAWAKDVLDALGRRTPGDAVQTTNDQVLIDVMHAYATTRDPDAVAVVLSFVNSERAQVRAAAREATLAYGQETLGRIRTTYAALTGERLPEGQDAADAARALFAAYDHYRLRDVYAQLDDGLARWKAGDVEQAIADFDQVLARQPMLDRRAEIAPAYAAYAETLERADRPRAVEYLRRAMRLEDADGGTSHIRSELLYLEGEDLMARGIDNPTPFEEALALDPSNAHARSRLDGLRAEATAQRARQNRVGAAVVVAGLAILALGATGIRRNQRR